MLKTLLEDVKIINKALLMLALLGVFGLGTALNSAQTMWRIDVDFSKLTDQEMPATTQLVGVTRFSTELMQAAYRGVDTGQYDAAAAAIRAAQNSAREGLDKAAGLDPGAVDQVRAAKQQMETLGEIAQSALGKARGGDAAGAHSALRRGDEALTALNTTMVDANNRRIASGEKASAALSVATNRGAWTALLLSLLGTALGIGAAYWVVRRGIMTPTVNLAIRMRKLADGDTSIEVPCIVRKDEYGRMAEALVSFRDAARSRATLETAKARADEEQQRVVETVGHHLAQMAAGDLTADINSTFPGGYELLRTNFNEAIGSLRALISSVAGSADQIRTGSAEIAQASEDLARRTEGSAASLEQTSAAIMQMDGRLKATAQAAGHTLERADQTIATVNGGRSVADDAVQAMGRVSDSAKGIDSVIEGLDKIAFQTRVLAMNAAVEAGRAGEAGRGFAVVADLVSALAMRAEEEAKRARDQLTVTQSDIVTAVDAVGNVDQALQAISGDVGAVHDLLNSITTDNQAQAVAITEISSAVSSLDHSTQQNAAMVEQTSAAARNLMSEVSALADQAGQFTVERRGQGQQKPARLSATNVYDSPVKPLPRAAVAALTRPSASAGADDWKEF